MFRHSNTIAVCDSEVWKFIQAESDRQEQHIELIASENYTSPAVMQAQGSLLTNKYAEGYPGKRYSAAASMLTRWSVLPLNAPRSSFASRQALRWPSMSSRTPALRPTKLFFSDF